MILETGTAQPEAMALYESAGYTPIASFGHYRESPENRCYGRCAASRLSLRLALALPRSMTVPAAVPSSRVIRSAVTFSPRLSDWSVTPVWMLMQRVKLGGGSWERVAERQGVGLAVEGQHAGDGALGVAPHDAAAAVGDQVDPTDDAVDGQRRVAGAERDVRDGALGPGAHAADLA